MKARVKQVLLYKKGKRIGEIDGMENDIGGIMGTMKNLANTKVVNADEYVM